MAQAELVELSCECKFRGVLMPDVGISYFTDLADGLQQAEDGNLVSLTVSTARFSVSTALSDRMSVLIVVRNGEPEKLAAFAPVIRRFAKKFGRPPFVVTHDDLRTSTDIFPIRYQNLQADYEVLAGIDVLAELTFEAEHVRLRCEQELCNVLLRLRNRFIADHDQPRALTKTLKQAAGPFLVALATAVELKTGLTPENADATLATAQKMLDLDSATIAAVRTITESGSIQNNVNQSYAAFVATAEAAVRMVDKLDTSGGESAS